MSVAGTTDFFYREAQRLGYVARSAFKLLQIQKQHKLITAGSSVLDLGCAPGAWLQVACQSLGPQKNGGVVVGIDLKKIKVPSSYCDSRVRTVCADVMNLPRDQIRALSPKKGYSVILSDMCPPVSGITTKDAALSIELGTRALELAVGGAALANNNNQIDWQPDDSTSCSDDHGLLHQGGHLVIKLLENEDVQGESQEDKRRGVTYLSFIVIHLVFSGRFFAKFGSLCKPLFRKASLLRPKATRSSSTEIYLICQGLQ
ncbi:Ribosomal RNA methyltransferase, FtsJ domain [Dillenia turbinata]|uniref:rRNA methyltransferase 2, mitochondrial n=1 Tax=Dillenia turbinata TaxID=194707 RepID=A0AAN8VSH8_9MAGN